MAMVTEEDVYLLYCIETFVDMCPVIQYFIFVSQIDIV